MFLSDTLRDMKGVAVLATLGALVLPVSAEAHRHHHTHHADRHNHVARRADACDECFTDTELAEAMAVGQAQEDEGRTPEEVAFSREPITPEGTEEERPYEGY